jgi:hypothetical protein
MYAWWLWLRDFLSTVFANQLFSGLLGVVVGGLITGYFSLSVIRHERAMAEEQERTRQTGARRALIAEMAENAQRLALLTAVAEARRPIAHMIGNLNLSRYALDAYMPLVAASVSLKVVGAIVTTYSETLLLESIESKWRIIASSEHNRYGGAFQAAAPEDQKALHDCAERFRRGLAKVSKALLSEEELRDFGDPQTIRPKLL